jgi:hypothetical protein
VRLPQSRTSWGRQQDEPARDARPADVDVPGSGHDIPSGDHPRADPRRLDLAIATVVQRQAEVLLAGVRVAALHGGQNPLNSGAVLPGGCPTWLAADLDLMVHLVRLAEAAGVVVPDVAAGSLCGDLADPREHLLSSQACYGELLDVLARMSTADEVAPPCREGALRLLRQVERRVRHLDDGHPAAADVPRARLAGGGRGGFIPGELLG